ncbi:elongation factor P [Impatiens glandulifera]|uniref:elongation factor P n=1 Tax=Impatiens glandulifera TaxID=253017 RepID=UPI001FB0E5A6|nr:elongation factor P [Impatiens glandulifera]
MRLLLSKRLFLLSRRTSSSSPPLSSRIGVPALFRTLTTYGQCRRTLIQPPITDSLATFNSPWSSMQRRGAKCRSSDLKPGNYIQKKGSERMYEVVHLEHVVQGRGGASIQVELRDVDSGNKSNERLRTDEMVEKIFVEGRAYTFLYIDGDDVVVMDPNTYEQLEISSKMIGNTAVYLKDGMTVSVQLFNEKLMSASIPQRVTCRVVEAQTPIKGIGATPHYKKVNLDNGLVVQVPPYILTGDDVIINTVDNSFHSRA